ncbi:hypothetical protein ACLOJK_035516 [Asimina triloba]
MDNARMMDLAQLLDAYEVYIARHAPRIVSYIVSVFQKGEHTDANLDFGKDLKMQSLSDRFMGLKAGIFSTCSSVESFGRSLGFSVLQFAELVKKDKQAVHDGVSIASELLRLLGFSRGVVLEKSDFDLLFVHIGATEKENDMKDEVCNIDIEWINSLVGGVMQIAQPGSVLASRLHFSVVMSYEVDANAEDDDSLTLVSEKETSFHVPLLFPQQSYTRKGGKLLNDIRCVEQFFEYLNQISLWIVHNSFVVNRHHHPMLVAQWQEAVTRRDLAQTFSFNEFKEKGCNLAIPAERFLHEVAFKLWKAPKYGA